MFGITLVQAPWIITFKTGSLIIHSPIWAGGGGRIDFGTLALEWLAIGVVYSALLFMFKSKIKEGETAAH